MRLLARKDYDAISMAEIAREAGCSISTVYDRYSDKESYLYRVIAHAFNNMADRAKLALDLNGLRRASTKAIVRQIVSHMISQMTAPRAAGVIRATLKLATVKPLALEPFEDYRSTVTDLSVDLLSDKLRQPPASIRIAMQIVLGTITDAVLQKHPGPMNAGSARMVDALTNVLLGYLGLAKGGSWAGDETDAEDVPEDASKIGSETPPELEEGEIAVFDPDNRTYSGRRSGLRKKHRQRGASPKLKKIDSPTRRMGTNNKVDGGKPTTNPTESISTTNLATSIEFSPKANRKAKHHVI